MAIEKYDFGMIGLGTMGRNLVYNMSDHGYSVAGYDKDTSKVDALEKESEDPALWDDPDHAQKLMKKIAVAKWDQLTDRKPAYALVADVPGLTRDRKYGDGKVGDWPFIVIDTGGLSGETEDLDGLMAQQAWQAISEADLVFLMVDGRAGHLADGKRIHIQRRVATYLRNGACLGRRHRQARLHGLQRREPKTFIQ